MFRVPPELQQRISRPQHEGLDFDILFGSEDKADSGFSTFLTDCGGYFKDLLVVVRNNRLIVFDVFGRDLLCGYNFDANEHIVSVDYHRLLSPSSASTSTDEQDEELIKNDGCGGLLIGVNNVKSAESFTAIVAINRGDARLIRKLAISDTIYCVKTLVSSYHMDKTAHLLHPKMRAYPHVVAIGTLRGHCYITHLDVRDEIAPADAKQVKTNRLTDALKSFVEDGKFWFKFSGAREKKFFNPSDACVSALGFVERARCLLIGLRFGGLVAVSLSDSPSIEPVMVPYTGCEPRFIESLVPENDPRPRLYFFVASNTSESSAAHITMYYMDFPQDEQLRINDPNSWQYKELHITEQLKIAAPDMRKFISMRCIVDELKKHHTDLDDTVVNTGPSQDQSRTLLSFFYLARNAETRELQLKGGLFDLNQHYFKRQVPRVAPDGTFAQQCPFVAFYHETPSPEMVASSLHDMIIDPFYLRRYSSNVSDELQMFYPSSYKMDKVYAASGSNMFVLSISSMVEQVLGRITARLAEHLSDPVPAFKWLSSIGLPIDADNLEPNSREHALAVVLSAIVYHDKLEELNTLVKNGSEEQGITDGLLMEMNDWLWQELQKQFKKMNDLMYPLFHGGSTGLNEADQNTLMACHSIFRAARYLYTSFMQRSATKMQCISVLEVRSNAAKMFEQSLLLHNYLHQNKILPVCDEVREVISKVRNDMPRRRRNAELRRRELFIEQLLKKLYDYCGAECFWLDRSPIGVYPPTILDLVSLLPLDSVPSRMKRTIILYYLIDFSNVQLTQNKENAEENSLLSTVNYIMSSIGKELKLTEEEADSILESWRKDTEEPETVQPPAILDTTGSRGVPNSPNVCRKEMKSELERLVSQPLLEYPPEDVARIKELLFTLYGKCLADVYWNCILFKQKRFQEFDTELKIPENLQEHHIVVQYLKTAIQLRQVRSYNIAYAMWDPSKKLSQEIVDKIKSFNQTTAEPASPHRSVFRQKTNINHRRQSVSAANSSARRGRNLNASGNGMDVSMLSAVDENLDKVEKTPESKCDVTLLDFDNDEDTPKRINQNASPSVLQELREIVRTPRARSRAAALAEGGVNLETTPEHAAPPVPTTHSILKSAKKAPTPSRGGIRWDPNVCTPDDADALNPPARSSSALSRPDFDDDLEESDQSHVMPKTSSKERVNVSDTPELEKSNGEEGESVDNDDDNVDDQMYGEESSRVVDKRASSSVNVSSLSNEEADQDTTAGMISSESIIDLDSPAAPCAVVVETESVTGGTDPANVAILQDSQETTSFPDSQETASSPHLHSHLEKEEEPALPTSQTPLVDYSFSDSSMLSTPGRTTVTHEIPSGSPQTRAILSRSFEEQDAADFEKEVESSFDVLEDVVESKQDSVEDKVATVLKRSFEQQDDTDFVEVDKAVAATPVSDQNHVRSHIRTQSSVIQTREVDGNVTATVVTVTETETAEAEREPISAAEKVSPKKVSIEEQDERDVTEYCEDDEPVVQDDVEDEEEELNLQMEKTVNHFGKAEKVSPKKVSIEEQDERDVTEHCEDDEPVVQDDVEDEEEELNLQMEKTVNHFGKTERRLLEVTPKTAREQKVPDVAADKTAEINVTPRNDIVATVSTVSPVVVAAPIVRDLVTPEKRNTEQALPSATASPSRRSVRLQNRADSEPPKPVPTPKKAARKSVAPSSIPEHDEEAGGTDLEPVRKSTRRRSASTSLAARNAGATSRPGYNAKANDWFAEEEKMLAETFGPKGNLDSRRLRLISAPVAAKTKTTRKKKEDATKEAEEEKPKASRTRASSTATTSVKEAAPKPIARNRSRSASRASAVVPIKEVPEEKTPKKSPTRRSRSASRTVLVDTVTPKKQKQAQLDVVTPVANATSPSRKSRRAASESRTQEVKSTSKRSTKKSVLEVDNVEVTPSRRGRRATDTSVVVKESKTPTKRGRKIAENAEDNSTSEKATPSKRGRKASASVV